MSWGCQSALVTFVVACYFFWTKTGYDLFLVVALPGFAIVIYGMWWYAYSLALLLAVILKWRPRGVRCLVIHSDSPQWADRVSRHWLPRLQHAAVVLNWSERATWKGTLSVLVFRHFCGTVSNFNPAVVVFRGLRRPLVFRFFYAFQEVRAGRTQYLERLEAEMFHSLGIERAAA
jgi:hypothetical protein